jgi:DNA-binding SARP family transcriptional activator/tetratricopeptide (TPR) repeat protein
MTRPSPRPVAAQFHPGCRAVKRGHKPEFPLVRSDQDRIRNVNFQILGPLLVTDDDHREIGLGGAKPAAVLAILLLHPNEVVSSDRLIDELWDEHPPPTAGKSLQVHISRLRRALGNGHGADGGPVLTRSGGYVLNVEPEQIDSARFETLVDEGVAAFEEGAHARASARLRCALGLWRGGALADFIYASFAQDAIARLDGLRMVAFQRTVDAELEMGRHAELIPELRSMVRANPLSERLRAQLMLALYRSGRQAEALGVYRAGRRVLVDQLGIEPGAELRDLERAILAQDPAIAAPAPERHAQRTRSVKDAGSLLVGYDSELAALEDLLEETLGGQERLALISGEPGVGKTRLADELGWVAETRGAQVVWGRCWQGGGAPPYWPWIQVLEALGHDLMADSAQPDGTDAQEARFRLFNATARFLRRAATEQPLVIVIDDLHAADPSTLTLLQFLAATAIDAPVLIVGTYRDTEIVLDHPLVAALAELGRAAEPTQLVLGGLTREDTAHYVEVSAGTTPMPALAAAIHGTSAGNPLFVGELVRLLQADDRLRELEPGEQLTLPRGVEQVITTRIQQLSADCRRTLALAAVAGREFDTRVLGRAGDVRGERLLELIEEAIPGRVIEPLADVRDRFRFSHELVRHALYQGIPAAERRRLHLAVAQALEQLQGTDRDAALPELAHHFSEALPVGSAEQAMRYLGLAGDRAAEMVAYEEAVSLYARAVEVAKPDAVPGELRELRLKLAEQLVLAGDAARTEAAIADADAALRAAPDRSLEARLDIVRAQHDLFDACTLPDGRIQQVIALYQEMGDPFGEARAWWALHSWHHGRASMVSAGDAARHMMECAKQAGSKALVDEAIRRLAEATARGPGSASAAAPRVRALLAEATYPITKARLLDLLAELEGIRGRFDEARALFTEAESLLGKADLAEIEACAAPKRAVVELLAGNALRAEEIERPSCAQLERKGQTAFLASELTVLVDALTYQGRFDEAEAELERATAILRLDDIDAIHRQARSRARLRLARGDVDGAEEAMQTAIEFVFRQDMLEEQAENLVVLAQVKLAACRPEEARAAAERALAISEERGHEVFEERARELLGRIGGAPDSRAAAVLVDQ